MNVNKMSSGGGHLITLKNKGLFFKVEASDAIICYYLLNNKINNQVLYIWEYDISLLLFLLDKLNINYLYLNTLHEFINNQYDYYLVL